MMRHYTPRRQIGTLFCHIHLIGCGFLVGRRHARNICCITASYCRWHISICYPFSLSSRKSPRNALAGMQNGGPWPPPFFTVLARFASSLSDLT